MLSVSGQKIGLLGIDDGSCQLGIFEEALSII